MEFVISYDMRAPGFGAPPRELYAAALAHPGVELRWIRAHQGNRWNEYADALATAWARPTL